MTALNGAVALVTGASSGIGRATALLLAARGCRVVVAGSDGARVRHAASQVGGEPLVCDLADTELTAALAADLAARQGVDVVVHNAGVGLAAAAAQPPDCDVTRLLAVNLLAPITLTAALLPAMVRRGSGRIAFVGSIAGAVGAPGESIYAATKAGLAGFADSLRVELAGTGVGVTVLVPGVVATGFFSRRGAPYPRRHPRPMSADRVARALVRGIEQDRSQVVVPGWLRMPIGLHAVAPQLYGRLAGRAGAAEIRPAVSRASP